MEHSSKLKSDTELLKSVEQTGNIANQHEHELGPLQAIRENPWVMLWCIYAIWMLILNSFENQAGGAVLGIPEFRKVRLCTTAYRFNLLTRCYRTSATNSKTIMYFLLPGNLLSVVRQLHRKLHEEPFCLRAL